MISRSLIHESLPIRRVAHSLLGILTVVSQTFAFRASGVGPGGLEQALERFSAEEIRAVVKSDTKSQVLKRTQARLPIGENGESSRPTRKEYYLDLHRSQGIPCELLRVVPFRSLSAVRYCLGLLNAVVNAIAAPTMRRTIPSTRRNVSGSSRTPLLEITTAEAGSRKSAR